MLEVKNIVTIITGSPTVGKSTLAKELVANKKAVWVQNFTETNLMLLEEVHPDTEVLVFDGLPTLMPLEIWNLITSNKIMIHKKNKGHFEMERPEIIIISQSLVPENIVKRPYMRIIKIL